METRRKGTYLYALNLVFTFLFKAVDVVSWDKIRWTGKVGRALGVLKMMRWLRLRKALAAVKHQRNVAERKAAVKQRKFFDYSKANRELSYFSLDDADD